MKNVMEDQVLLDAQTAKLMLDTVVMKISMENHTAMLLFVVTESKKIMKNVIMVTDKDVLTVLLTLDFHALKMLQEPQFVMLLELVVITCENIMKNVIMEMLKDVLDALLTLDINAMKEQEGNHSALKLFVVIESNKKDKNAIMEGVQDALTVKLLRDIFALKILLAFLLVQLVLPVEIRKLKVLNNAIMEISLDVLDAQLTLVMLVLELNVKLFPLFVTILSDKLEKNVIMEEILDVPTTAESQLDILAQDPS